MNGQPQTQIDPLADIECNRPVKIDGNWWIRRKDSGWQPHDDKASALLPRTTEYMLNKAKEEADELNED